MHGNIGRVNTTPTHVDIPLHTINTFTVQQETTLALAYIVLFNIPPLSVK